MWLIALLAVLGGCATLNPITPRTPAQTAQERAQEIEPILETAGFQSLLASTTEQKNRLKALPSLKLGYYADRHGGANYWLADPDYCGCLFHGDEAAYQRYELLKKDNRTAELDREAMRARRYQQPPWMGPWGPLGFGPGAGFGFGPGTGLSGGFGFSL